MQATLNRLRRLCLHIYVCIYVCAAIIITKNEEINLGGSKTWKGLEDGHIGGEEKKENRK